MLSDVSKIDSQIITRNWKLSGPFYNSENSKWRLVKDKIAKPDEDVVDYSNYMRFEKDPSDNIFKENIDSLRKAKKLSTYYQDIDFLSFNLTLNTKAPATAYAETTINSEIEQDVAFLMGLDGAIKMWVNGKLYLREPASYFAKNQYAIRVHLKNGENKVVIKSYNNAQSKEWGLHLDIASIAYVRKFTIGRNWFSISQASLIKKQDPLALRIKHPTFIPVKRPAKLLFSDLDGNPVLDQQIQAGYKWNIPLKDIREGVYSCRLITDLDTFEQKFVYGDHHRIYEGLVRRARPLEDDDFLKVNIETLKERYLYLDSAGRESRYLENTQIKIASTLYELASLVNRLSKGSNGMAHTVGLHLRGVRSDIDLSVNNYMVYIPEQYRTDKPLPLVVIMPFITKAVPFVKSWHVADLDKIEYLKRLGKQFGFGIIWPSSRTYAYYNLNPMAATATFEAIEAVKKDYNIDDRRIYLYGDCTGGLLALLTASRYPSYFAAVSAKGPELSYTDCEYPQYKCIFPSQWARDNSVFNTIENYSNLPILLMQTRDDAKADSKVTQKLYQGLKEFGSHVVYDDLNNATRTKTIGLVPENNILYQTFQFFKTKSVKIPDTVTFSTYQAKYNHAYWVAVNGRVSPQKAYVRATFKKPNVIQLEASNVRSLTFDLDKLPQIAGNKKIKIIARGKDFELNYPNNNKLLVNLSPPTSDKLTKSSIIEGPINHTFAGSFLVVQGTGGTAGEKASYSNALQTFSSNWQASYFHGHRWKYDNQVNTEDLKSHNLILIGSAQSNVLIRKVIRDLPLKVTSQYVEINKKRYPGNSLYYMMVYPNPLNQQKYVVVIGANSNNQDWSQIKDLPLRGWYDYEVWDRKTMVGSGYFNNNWM